MNGDGDMREQAIKTRDNNLVSSCLLLKRSRSPRGSDSSSSSLCPEGFK